MSHERNCVRTPLIPSGSGHLYASGRISALVKELEQYTETSVSEGKPPTQDSPTPSTSQQGVSEVTETLLSSRSHTTK